MRIVALGLLVVACSDKPDPRVVEMPLSEVCALALSFREHNDDVRRGVLQARDSYLEALGKGGDAVLPTFHTLGVQLLTLQRSRYLTANTLRAVAQTDPRLARFSKLAYELSGGPPIMRPSDGTVDALRKPLEDELAKVQAAEKAVEDECGRVMTSIRR